MTEVADYHGLQIKVYFYYVYRLFSGIKKSANLTADNKMPQ